MPRNEGAASIEVEARSFFYDSGAGGQPLPRAVAVEAPVEVVIGAAPFAVMMATPRDLEELCVIRVTLEAEALRLAVPRLSSEDLARLEGYMAEMAHYAKEQDYRRWTMPHRQFHRALTAPAGERINDLLGQLFDHAERYRRLHIGHGPSAWATAGHREILDACKRGDRDRSASLLAGHLARTGLEVSELLDPDYDPAELRNALVDVGGEIPKKRARKGAKV